MRSIFKKYGRELTCPETNIKIFNPETLNAIHDYKKKDGCPKNLDFIDIT